MNKIPHYGLLLFQKTEVRYYFVAVLKIFEESFKEPFQVLGKRLKNANNESYHK